MKTNRFFTALALCGALAYAATARAEIIVAQHLGDTNPTTEGWSLNGLAGSAVDDGGTLAWAIDDNSSSSAAYYSDWLTAEQGTQADSDGWKLTAKVRVVTQPSSPNATVMFNYLTSGGKEQPFQLGSESDGDAIIKHLPSGSTYTCAGGGNVYHTYEVVFNPGVSTTTVDLFVDGFERLSDLSFGTYAGGPKVTFGSATVSGTGHGNWNEVTFEIVPEPSTLALTAVGLLWFGLYAWRRRKSVGK